MIKRLIPNALTMGNLLCGCVAIMFAVNNHLDYAALFVVIGIIFDFFDGFAARILNVTGELGKQLDSLADMVTSGVVPGIVMYKLFQISQGAISTPSSRSGFLPSSFKINSDAGVDILASVGFVITLASAYRLAKFNIDTRQTDSFIGVPTPANTLLILSLPLILRFQSSDLLEQIILSPYFLIAMTLLSAYLLNANIPLFALKFKSFGLAENKLRYSFLIVSIVLLIILKFIAIPFIIVLYIVLSLLNRSSEKTA